ncbi:MAG TPA: TspO/MBR family protein [Chitinispirillaceae bacterium]|nr:TspO/MBR family protein [Chitinispirillaceae bacterium]
MNTIFRYISSIAICESVGFISGLVSSPDSWYTSLKKPSITPPSWVFAPVWTLLYALMGISAAMVIHKNEKATAQNFVIFSTQLLLNFLWTILFFGLHLPLTAFIDILLLLATILLTYWKFLHISKLAAILLIPYILWVSFASVLNFEIWRLNRP